MRRDDVEVNGAPLPAPAAAAELAAEVPALVVTAAELLAGAELRNVEPAADALECAPVAAVSAGCCCCCSACFSLRSSLVSLALMLSGVLFSTDASCLYRCGQLAPSARQALYSRRIA